MSKSAAPGDLALPPRPVDALPRAEGRLDISFARRGAATVLGGLYQQGSAKARLPKVHGGAPPEAVFINLAGGITGGDRFHQHATFGEGSHAVITSQAAEKIYRASAGAAPAIVQNTLNVAADAVAEWLPQETIIFNGAKLRRRLHADLVDSARLMACEAMVFGRTAMGETVLTGSFRDDWRIAVDGTLVFADALCLEGAIQDQLDRPAVARGGRALASLLYVGADAEAMLAPARQALDKHADEGQRAAVSRMGPVLLARFIAADLVRLKPMLAAGIEAVRDAAGLPGGLPKLWRC